MYDKNTKKLLSGAAWLGLSAILLKIIGLVYKIPMSYLLGDEGMGYFNSAYTVYTFFYIIGSAGIPKAVSILCAKVNESEAKSVFILIYRVYLLLGAILSVTLLISADFIADSIGNSNSFYSIFAISPTVFFVCASGVLRGYLNGKTKFIPVATSEIISAFSKLFIGLFFAFYAIKKGYSLPIVCSFSILGITIGSFFGFVYLYLSYSKESKYIKKSYLSKKKILRDVLRLGLPITFATMVSGFVNIIDLAVVMNRLKASGYPESICTVIYGNYTTLAVPLFSFATNLINSVSVAALPIITAGFSNRKYTEMKKTVSSSVKVMLFISIPAFLAFLLFPVEILGAIFEEGSAKLGSVYLFFLSPGILFYSLLTLTNTVLEGSGNIKAAVTSLTAGAIAKCILSYIFIGMEKIGPIGAPLSTTASYVISLAISYYYYNKNIVKNRKFHLSVIDGIPPLLFSALLSSVLAILAKTMLFKNLNFRANSIVVLCIYGIFYLFFSIIFTIIREKKQLLSAKCTIN